MRRTFAIALAVSLAACGGDDDGDGASDATGSDGGGPVIDGAPGGSDGAAATGCAEYCATVMPNCVMTLQQYKTVDSCMAACALFPPGEAGAESGDSLACRVTHAALAVDTPDPHCRHAGPSGGGVCGAPCDAYCDLVMGACEIYADDGECMDTCAGFPEVGNYSTHENLGDSVECRIAHATMATADPQSHCGPASPDSTPCSN